MNEENLIKYYNKFNEDKRLTRRHGIIEYRTAMHYLEKYLSTLDNPKIIDIGAGTGSYSIPLSKKYDVTAVELVKHNLMTLKRKSTKVKSYLGNALDLSIFKDNTFDIVILFGPMYHLIKEEDKIKALSEAKRIVKEKGLIFISYYMNEYAIIKHGFIENTIKEAIKTNKIDKSFKITPTETDLYSMVRLEDINHYKNALKLKRIKILSQDGATDYLRKEINKMDTETFELYYKYHLSICEREDLLGASSHVLDILQK